jgi:hypothetical protein
MRQIQFRAYYKGSPSYKGSPRIPATMCNVVGFEKTSDKFDTIVLDSIEQKWHGRLAVPMMRIKCEENECVLMQFTGLLVELPRPEGRGFLVHSPLR